MALLKYFLLIGFLLSTTLVHSAGTARHFPPGVRDIYISNAPDIRSNLLENIAPVVETSINRGLYPGAVILAGHKGQIIYRGVFGNRRIVPNIAPMTFDTIFDLASLTKVIVTTTAVMQLVEQGKLDLDAPVARYWPAFGNNGKQNVTVRQLLTHTSGFQPDLVFPTPHLTFPNSLLAKPSKSAQVNALRGVELQKLIHLPGTVFKYSDVNFITLGHLVEIISGEDLSTYAKKHIFDPLGMQRTFYLPPSQLRNEIAPTEIIRGKLRWGEVNDDTVYLMGGVAGMAGLFSDAQDLGIFAQTLIDGGRIPSQGQPSRYLLSPLSVIKMATPQTPPDMTDVQGLGWDIDTRYSNRGVLFTNRSYGHTGWTGTSIWLDPVAQTWLIILTSRTHPTPAAMNPLIHDRKTIANIVAASIKEIPSTKVSNTGKGEIARAFNRKHN